MVLNTFTVGASVTPTVVKTYASHYINRKSRAQKPTAHISYDEGLALIRQFLHYASNHTVEELQAFTSQWVPNPRWVKVEEITIPKAEVTKAADILIAQLGHRGVDRVGGKLWWQWRKNDKDLQAEWIEMRSHYQQRKKSNEPCKRIMLYVHGGAYFFGSVDEHRYQLQRHARKLQARVLAPRYRLAPQFPFPCGLHDCLSTYLYLLTVQDPSTIVLAGDSAGGGMVLSVLCVLRDQGIPLPAGAVLISPWVDLTHSFPSLAGDGKFDYIPAHGFMQRPSVSWPPPNEDEIAEITRDAVKNSVLASLPRKSTQQEREEITRAAQQGFEDGRHDDSPNSPHSSKKEVQAAELGEQIGEQSTGLNKNISVEIDGKRVVIKDQIQMYATNQLIDHPLVSPVLQPSLGGLPPLLILTGGGELLKDEQIYLAYKAANPKKYRPSEAYLEKYPEVRATLDKYKPTDVQLQVWSDLCHVAPTLSFTRPAKFMFRSIAQFSAWALAKAQKTEIDILDDDQVSIISSGSDTDGEEVVKKEDVNSETKGQGPFSVGKAGDPLPHFKRHMIEQSVDRHGNIFPIAGTEAALNMKPEDIGVPKAGPVKKWLTAKTEWDNKFSSVRNKVKIQRAKEIAAGYQSFGNDDVPPPSALAGRRGASMPKDKKKKSMGLSLWALWGSSHDKETLDREANADKEPENIIVTAADGATLRPGPGPIAGEPSRSRSRHRIVSYGHEDESTDGEAVTLETKIAAPAPAFTTVANDSTTAASLPSSNGKAIASDEGTKLSAGDLLVLPGTNVTLDSPSATRPKADGIAFPFKLNRSLAPGGTVADDASMMTLKSEAMSLEDEKSIAGVVGGEDATSIQRPVPERFETAHEIL